MADSLALNDTQRAAAHIGTRAGEYLIESFLGAGAMGEVYAGRHPEIGKRVAIKVLKSTVADGSEAAERFKREARVVNQIAHPNVIDVFAFGRLDDGRLYLVMDLVEGETLRAAVANGPLAIDQTLDILDQVADALDAAHAKGVVHRDLKPDNVMLSNGKIFVLDFGIAKLVATGDGTPPSLLTGQGAWIGTPSYMAPEQWSADGAGPASDRYALGVMAFELLSGKRPFDAGTLPQLMEQHFRAPVPALSTRGAVQARASFDPVLARAMAKDPAERYPTAKALVAALREVAGKRVRAPLRRPWLPAVLGVGVLGLGIAGVVIARGRPDGKPSASGLVAVTVRSNPPRATVLANGRLLGTTPLDVDLRAGEPLVLVVQKPGYTTVTKTVAPARGTVEVVLAEANGFEGTWVLPDGQLRAFTRSGDEHVDVWKLASLTSDKTFYRKFSLEDAPRGIRFASTETVVDARAPDEPSCQVPVRVEYLYEPTRDVLEVRPEGVETGFQHGRCVVHSRELAAPVALVRADASATDLRISRAPMGRPADAPVLRSDVPVVDRITSKPTRGAPMKREVAKKATVPEPQKK